MAPTDISPLMPIKAALALEYEEDPLYYEEAGKMYVVRLRDLENMIAMNLGDLPIECVALESSSPILVRRLEEDVHSYDIGGRLTEFFPISFVAALYELQSLLNKSEVEAYVIGGITRDLLLYNERRLEIQDVDVTIEGDALAFVEFLSKHSRNFIVDDLFPEFGTAKVHYKDCVTLDFASTRKEVYTHCGALPQVVQRGVSLFEDINRRDFTINALALSVNTPGRIVDYSNGIADIESGAIRVLHPTSFYEDPSRILRAYKFAARFGFSFSPGTQRLISMFLKHGAPHYRGGGERIRYELGEFLAIDPSSHKNRCIANFMDNKGLHLINMDLDNEGSLPDDRERLLGVAPGMFLLQEHVEDFQDKDTLFLVYLCMLFQDLPEEALTQCVRRLGLTREELHVVTVFRQLHAEKRFLKLREFLPPPEIYALFHGLPRASVGAAIIDAGNEDPTRFKLLLDAFKTYRRKWEHVTTDLDGNDLIDLGVPKGPAVGVMLKKLLNARLAGRVVDRMSEVHFVQQTLEEEAAQQENAADA